MQDEEFETGVMNGAPHKRGKFAGSLRRYLFSEHLGLINPPEQEEETVFPAPPSCRDTTDDASHGRSAIPDILPTSEPLKKKPLSVADIADPVSDHFFADVWRATATTNTAIYDEVTVEIDVTEYVLHIFM